MRFCGECLRRFSDDRPNTEGCGISNEEVKKQLLPGDDEAPMTSCPWCGQEYNVREEIGDAGYEKVGQEKGIYWHKPCGGLGQFASCVIQPSEAGNARTVRNL